MSFALMTVLLVSGGAIPDVCEPSGTVALERKGKPVKGAQVVVYVEPGRTNLPRRAPQTHRMVQLNRQFSPQFLIAVKGDTVEFPNEDRERHSVFSNASKNTFDLPPSMKGMTGVHQFEQVEWVHMQCNIHGSMRADVVVVPTPWYAQVDGSGAFKLPPIAFGSYTLVAVEANGGSVKQVVQACEPVKLQLSEAPAPRLRHKNGDDYNEYEQ